MRRVQAFIVAVLAFASPLAAHAQSPPKLTPALVAFWSKVQRCEEGVTGWTTQGSRYEGGLGFAVTTWAMWARQLGLYGRYPHAWMAPPIVQMRVAEYGWRNHGYWGTIEPHGSCAGWHP